MPNERKGKEETVKVSDQREEELVRRVLKAVGPQRALPDELRERWESTFRDELDRVLKRRLKAKRIVAGAIAASVAAVAVAAAYMGVTQPATPPVAYAVSVRGDSVFVGEEPVRRGTGVAAGQTIETGAGAHVSLRYREVDVRLGARTDVRILEDRLGLGDGVLYVDSGPEPSMHRPVVIETDLGTLSHVGTQFMVDVHRGALTAAVREGTILLTTESSRDAFSAEGGDAKLVKVSEAGEIDVGVVPTHGGMWTWVLEASPGFERNAASQHEFLTWLARETGTTLTYESELARRHAADGKVVGLAGQPIDRAIEIVNVSTGLRVSSGNGAQLRVGLKESAP